MRFFLLLSLSFILSFSLSAQKTPDAVLTAFSKKYPNADTPEWEFFEEKYTASFFDNDDYVVSIFDLSGSWLQSTNQITEEQLPRKVVKCWKRKYKDVQFVTAILRVNEREKKPMYHLSFESRENLVNLVYNQRGRIKKKFSEPIILD